MPAGDGSAPGPRLPIDVDLAGLAEIAAELALGAGRLVRDDRPVDVARSTKSSATDVVTEMDTRSEAWLRARLQQLRPEDGLLGEEGSSVESRSGITWVVDPIDGTTNYLYRLPTYAVSVAAVVGAPPDPGWAPVVGAVFAPELGWLWTARLGAGALRRRVELSGAVGREEVVSTGGCTELGPALLATGFGYRDQVRSAQATLLARVLPAVRDIRRLGSAAIDLCLVADGRVDGYYESGLNPWDLAAGWLIAAEAGALVTDGRSGAPSMTLTVAANPVLHPLLASLVAH